MDKAREEYRQKQQEKGRPVIPREPLKRTADNNWVHVYCALWIPETKFTSPNRLDMVEGIGAPTLRYDSSCKICKTTKGACVTCHHCHASFHVGCAHNAGYTFGFDVTPVKATRRDAVSTVTINGETGSMTAAIWCKEHPPKTVFHPMDEEAEGYELIALQLFARQFKQADLTLTGTARKANLVDQSTRIVPQTSAPVQNGRRTSTVTNQTPTSARGRQSNAGLSIKQEEAADPPVPKPERKCVRCKIDVSPRWWKVEEEPAQPPQVAKDVDGPAPTNGVDASGYGKSEHAPHVEHSQLHNGSVDHPMSDAPPVVSPEPATRLRVDTDVSVVRSVSYLCQKCHWKKLNAPDESPERERSQSTLPEAQQLPVRSPPLQPYAAPPPPPSLGGPWMPPAGAGVPPQQHQQPHPLPPWHGNGPPPPGPPPLHNGIGHPPPGPSLGHPPPFHSAYNPMHQPNGYPSYSGPGVHPPMPPAPLRGTFAPPPVTGPPPPLHLSNNGIMVNGMHSPRVPYSPTHPHGHNSSRSTESPFTGPPPIPQYPPIHHGSPAPSSINNRPSTPRDAVMRDAPAVTAPSEPRVSTGASASPSLRNLLH